MLSDYSVVRSLIRAFLAHTKVWMELVSVWCALHTNTEFLRARPLAPSACPLELNSDLLISEVRVVSLSGKKCPVLCQEAPFVYYLLAFHSVPRCCCPLGWWTHLDFPQMG